MQNYTNIPETTLSKIFLTIENSIEYLIDEELLPIIDQCSECKSSMRLEKDVEYNNLYVYRCKNKICRKRKNIFKNRCISSPRIEINKYLLAVYEILARDYEKRIMNDCGISKCSLQKIKNNCIKFFNFANLKNKNLMMGGEYSVQVDETVIYKGKLILSPSEMYDDFPNCTWLLGIIEAKTGRMHIEIVPNRKSKTIKKIFEKHIYAGTLIITDGYPSYPKAIKDNFCIHEIVNHSIGFKNENNYHTNNIENLWSQLKYEEKKRNGIKQCYIKKYLEEFIWRFFYLKSYEFKEIGKCWYMLIEYLINN